MNQPTSVPSPSTNGHEANGHFARGNPGGPGNPFARKMASLRRAMLAAVTEQDMEEVTAAVAAKAKRGDVAAAKLLYTYVPGKPSPAPDPDAMDAHEMRNYFATIVPMGMATELMQGFPLAVLLAILPHVLKARQEAVSQQVTDGIPQAQQQHQQEQDKKARREERRRKYHEEREARRAERRRQHEQERKAPAPSTNGNNGAAQPANVAPPPSPNGSTGKPHGAMSDRPPSTNGVGTVDGCQQVPGAPSTNGDTGGLIQEAWEAIMRRLLGQDELPPPDGAA